MIVDSPAGQTCIAKWSLAIGSILIALSYYCVDKWLAAGMVFGLVLMLTNWRVLSKIIRIAFRISSPTTSRAVAFLFYHIRFWILVLIMFLVIPKTNMYFGIGTFLGFLIPKSILGVILFKSKSEEWWVLRFPAKKPPEPELTYIEKELLNKNPFEVDPIEVELRRYYNNLKGES